MNTSGIEPISKIITVNAGIERVFAVFVTQFDAIKPGEHNLLPVPIAQTVFEPKVGGHIYDVGVDGSECRWSRVLAYETPSRLVFTWDIGPTWQLETDPAKTSEVEGPVHCRIRRADSGRIAAPAPRSTRFGLDGGGQGNRG